MRHSHLIQRLREPYKPDDGKTIDVSCLAFGGGLKNGGFSPEAMALLKEIWTFDYMGSAEFEFGKVPDALKRIAEEMKEYICGSFVTPYEYTSFRGKEKFTGKKRAYYLCKKDDEEEVRMRLTQWAVKDIYLKEALFFNLAMSGEDKKYNDYQGWVDIVNDFFFFTDETMWRDTCKIFGVATPSKKKVSKAK